MDHKKFSRMERSKALSALIFLVDKCGGMSRARKCAVGSKQQTWKWEGYKKEDGVSPTVATAIVTVPSVIDDNEERGILTLNE